MSSSLPDFVLIGPQTSLFTPPNPIKGQLIILCTWLGAAPKHIAKYVGLHQRIAPGVRILLIESTIPILLSTYQRQRSAIQPAVLVTLDVLADCSGTPPSKAQTTRHPVDAERNGAVQRYVLPTGSTPKIVLHIFSNGGGNSATQLLISLRSRLGSPLPLAGLILDSGPSRGTYRKSYDAMLFSLPPSLLSRTLGPPVIHCILLVLFLWIACGNEHPASLGRRTLLDPTAVRGTGRDGTKKVCLLYSKADRMCDWTDVRAYAEESRRRGWCVEEVVFEGSGHCAHLLKDEARYTEVVGSMWGRGRGD